MIIDKIKFQNYRQYKDFEINAHNDKKDIVILAENGVGKSTFRAGILIALYGIDEAKKAFDDITSFDSSIGNLITQELKTKKEISVIFELSISIRSTNSQIRIRREFIFEKGQYVRTSASITSREKTSNSNKKVYNQEQLEDIIPKSIAELFIFNGEGIEKINDGKGLKPQIERVLWIEVLRNMKKELQSVKSEYHKLYEVADNTNALKLMQEINKNKKSREENLNVVIIKETENEKINEELKSISKEIRKYENLKRDEIQRDRCQKDIEDANNRNENLISQASSYLLNVSHREELIQDMYYDVLQKLSKVREEELISGINVTAIDEILEREKCVCGSNITPEIEKVLLEFKKIAPPNSLLSLKKDLKNKVSLSSELIFDWVSFIQNSDISDEKKMEKNDLIERIKSIGDVSIIAHRREVIESQKDLNLQEIGKLKLKIEALNRIIVKSEMDYNKLVIKNDKNTALDLRIEIITDAMDQIDITIDSKASIALTEISKKFNKLLQDNNLDYKGIELSNNFKLKVTHLSTGQKVLVNFLYLYAIFNLAEEQVRMDSVLNEKNLIHYPFVLDAPYSTLGREYISSLSKIIFSTSSQKIIFTLDKEFDHLEQYLDSSKTQIHRLTMDKKNVVMKEFNGTI